jgi:hypothetical protein
VKAVAEIRKMIRDEGRKKVGGKESNELEAAVSAEFHQWLKASGNLRQVSDLLALSSKE